MACVCDISIDKEAAVVIFRWQGVVTTEDIINARNSNLEDTSSLPAIWDLSAAYLSELDMSELTKLAEYAASIGPIRGSVPDLVVINVEDQATILKLFMILIEMVGQAVPHYIFNSREDAYLWLKSDEAIALIA